MENTIPAKYEIATKIDVSAVATVTFQYDGCFNNDDTHVLFC
jgi:hypothetical protein